MLDNGGQTYALLTTIIATGGAIVGGIVGSSLTYRHNRAIEEQKNNYAKELEQQKILAQRVEEKKFNAKIREIVRLELDYISRTLASFLQAKEFDDEFDEGTRSRLQPITSF